MCDICGGRGEVQSVQRSFLGQVVTSRPCPNCRGFGEVIPDPCRQCGGDGRVRSRRTVGVRIPAGVADGMRVRLAHQGEVGPGGGPAGDLYVEVDEMPHEVFTRDGADLHCTVQLPMTAAALGTTLELPTLDGQRGAATSSAGTQTGTVRTLRGKGMPRLRSTGRVDGHGDLMVHVDVVVPTRLDQEQTELLRKLAALRGEEQPDLAAGNRNGHGLFSRLRDSFGALGSPAVEAVVDLGGVRTWYAVDGAGEPLVYLHGGFSDSDELDPVRAQYAARFRLYTPDRRAHGRTADVEGPLDFEMRRRRHDRVPGAGRRRAAHLVGFSDGATAALHVALRRPDLVRRMVLISGQFHRNGLLPDLFGDDLASAAAGMVESPLAKRYAAVSPDGAEHYPVVAEKIMRMAFEEPQLDVAELRGVQARTLVVSGDDDVVRLEHTLELYRGIPDAELAVVPGTSHVLILEKPDLVARLVLDFLTTEPVATRIPIRRK